MNSFKRNILLIQFNSITNKKNKYIRRNIDRILRNINTIKETIEENYNNNDNSLFKNKRQILFKKNLIK